MGQKQFEEFQSNVGLLTSDQLMRLQEEIDSRMDRKEEPLVTEEELDLISSLFR